MQDRTRRGVSAVPLLAALLLVAAPVHAQDEPFAEPAAVESAPGVGAVSIGPEVGLPLVVGLDASYRIAPDWRIGMAIGRLSGITTVRAEARRLFGEEKRRSMVLSLTAGAEQYFLDDDGREATPVGVHLAAGFTYHFDSPLSFGVRIGLLKTFGSSDGGDIRVFSVRNDYSTGILNAGLRFHF